MNNNEEIVTNNRDILTGAIQRLFLETRGPTFVEHEQQSALAVADYLEAISGANISNISYSCETATGHVEKAQFFGPSDWHIWKQLAGMLRNPEKYKGDTLAVAKAWEVLCERGARVDLVSEESSEVAKNLQLTFNKAADYILKETGEILDSPHNFEPNRLPLRHCFIP